MGIIQNLIDEGALVLYHDYRSGSAYDFSGHGNSGALTDTSFTGDGVRFPDTTSVDTVADALEVRVPSGATFIVTGDFDQHTDTRLISKRDGTGSNYEFTLGTSNRIYMNAVYITYGVTGSKYVAASLDSGETPVAWIDGVSVGNMSGTTNINSNASDVLIGNFYTGNYNFDSIMETALIINRKLTAAEHLELYTELENKIWPTKVRQRVNSTLWTTAWGAYESNGNTTGGQLENSEFQVSSGSFKISRDTIENRDCKVIECVTAGVFYVPTSFLNQTQTESAYGTWRLWWSKATSNNLVVMIIDSLIGNSSQGNNYNFIHRTDGTIDLRRGTTNIAGSSTTYAVDTWHSLDISRGSAGEFVMIANNEINATVTDNTHTTSAYMVFDFDAGDKIAIADINNGHTITKSV